MGTNDLAKELRAGLVPGRAPLLWGLGRCVNAARFADKVILDGVYNDVKNPEGFAEECRQGAEFGFDGKTLIHPTPGRAVQRGLLAVEPRRSSTPVASSRRSKRASPRARAWSPSTASMIENLHVDNARRALAIAAAIESLTP